jgi:RNA binding exosome subunit
VGRQQVFTCTCITIPCDTKSKCCYNYHKKWGEFIAIIDGEIIGDTSSEALLEKIRQKVEDKDIDSVFQTYISKTDDIIW